MKTATYNRFVNRLAAEIMIKCDSLTARVRVEEYHSALIFIFIFGNNLQLCLRADNYLIPAHRQVLIAIDIFALMISDRYK